MIDTATATAAVRMMRLFEGYAGAYGTHGKMERNAAKGGKQEIKKSARTVREPVTEELWATHLREAEPTALGIIPIREDGQCKWGCIDVDRYDMDLVKVVQEIKRRKLPMVVCRTKSGGAHVFLFLAEAAPAEQVRAHLKQVAASMGWGECEIFPKQNQILAERGDLGNWLNMPYLGGDTTQRYAIKETSGGMTVGEFLDYAERRRVLLSTQESPAEAANESLDDGPPCLQHLTTVGFPEGTRNNGLFGLGIFCKRKFGGRWKEMLEQYNREYMRPPLPADEVMETIKNLERKDYQYKCSDAPCVSYCNSTLCRTRKFGVGGGGMYPVISGLSKLDAGPATLWFLDIEGERIEVNTEQLQNYRLFQKVCMEQLTVFFMPMKLETWAKMVGEAMQNALIIEAAPEITAQGHFLEILEDFCLNRHRGQTVEDLWLGKPWQDPETERHYFRLRDLMDFLDKARFRDWGRNHVAQWVDQVGGRHFFNIKGKGCNVYWVPANFHVVAPLDLPKSRKDPV